MLTQFSLPRCYALHGFAHFAEEPLIVPGFLFDEEIREERVGGILNRDHDSDGAVVFGNDHGLSPGRIEEFTEVVFRIAGSHDFHRQILKSSVNVSIVATLSLMAKT